MNRYTATFADGTTIRRGTKRTYSAAWRVTWRGDSGDANVVTGFAVSEERASPPRPIVALMCRGMSSAQKAEVRRRNAEFIARSGYLVEFAPVVLSKAGG